MRRRYLNAHSTSIIHRWRRGLIRIYSACHQVTSHIFEQNSQKRMTYDARQRQSCILFTVRRQSDLRIGAIVRWTDTRTHFCMLQTRYPISHPDSHRI